MAKSLFLYRKNSIFIPDNLSENKKTGNMELIINATLLLAAIVLWIYGQYWRKKCGKVLWPDSSRHPTVWTTWARE
jgi:hypothetical protein